MCGEILSTWPEKARQDTGEKYILISILIT